MPLCFFPPPHPLWTGDPSRAIESIDSSKGLIGVFPRLSTTKNVVGSSSDVKTPQGKYSLIEFQHRDQGRMRANRRCADGEEGKWNG